MRTMFKAMAGMIFALSVTAAAQTSGEYLYKASLVQAAPGKLLALIDLYKSAAQKSGADEPPLWMRHSQGDHWDLLILYPMGSYNAYYQRNRVVKREGSSVQHKVANDGLIAWQEDTFVYGPPLAELRKRFAGAGFFHVEMFQALPGKERELYKEREMENDYLRRLQAPDNLIFTREAGGAWDLFTIGFYRDLKAYAEAADRPQSSQDAAAKAAGFEASNQIGPFLRNLISTHHDTLAVAIK
jgi:hypothetical protein